MTGMMRVELPIPPHFDPEKIGAVWRVPYQDLAGAAAEWAGAHGIRPAIDDELKVCLIAIDVQNTFCIPGFELYVGGRSGTGAIDDNCRLCEFIYRNLDKITQIVPTMDTHQAMHIFHGIFLVDDAGEHPAPYTQISVDDITTGRWRFNEAISRSLGISAESGQRHLEYYTRRLRQSGKYELTIWPYHAMLGGIGHALVSAFEEAMFFHTIARYSQPDFHVKGRHPLTEHYSVIGPEVALGPHGEPLVQRTDKIMRQLIENDVVVIAGQAKSHCVAWTIADLLDDVMVHDEQLVRKVHLLEDCTSPVVVPGVVDYTEHADAAFRRFQAAGMHAVRSTLPIAEWPCVD
jgi:nicotinamidase-related amidase